jgi:cellobiose phosphorylase
MLLTNAPRFAQVTGEAKLKVPADRAILTVKITTSARELGAALRANQQVRSKFIGILSAQGIPADQVKASKFSSTEKYSVFSDKVKSHRVNNLLKVTARSEKEFQVVADAIDNLPEAQYLGADFERSDKEEMKAKAIGAACDNANQRKQVFEEKLGLKLTVRRFLDPNAFVPVSPPGTPLVSGNRAYGFDWYLGNTLAGIPNYVGSVQPHAEAQRETEESGFGELTFRSRVTVEYLVEGR